MTGRLLAGAFLALFATNALVAEEPAKLPDVTTFDKAVVDSLREVHNRGADLYNTSREYEGAYRMYQGGLIAVRPLLNHRPAAQKIIDTGIAAANQEPTLARQAFKLHETIESVRKYLKDTSETATKPVEPKTKMPEVAPMPKEVDTGKKPKEEPKKPKEEPKKPKEITPPPAKATGASGVVTLMGKPLTAAEVTLISLDLPKPRVFTTTSKDDGSFAITDKIPPGRYVVTVVAKGVPEKFTLATSSGVILEVKDGASMFNIALK